MGHNAAPQRKKTLELSPSKAKNATNCDEYSNGKSTSSFFSDPLHTDNPPLDRLHFQQRILKGMHPEPNQFIHEDPRAF